MNTAECNFSGVILQHLAVYNFTYKNQGDDITSTPTLTLLPKLIEIWQTRYWFPVAVEPK